MTSSNLHTLNSSLLALPVVMIFTRRLLLSYKSPATVGARALDEKIKLVQKRAHILTNTLKSIAGYNHHRS